MRVLFVSGTTVGGSGRSQRDLVTRLREMGHEVLFLVDDDRPARPTRLVYEQLADLAAKVAQRPGASLVRAVERLPGRRTRVRTIDGTSHRCTAIPENAFTSVVTNFRPDVVVGSSILRLTWRKVRDSCDDLAIPTLLYIREEAALNHFAPGGRDADVVVANSMSLTESVQRLGRECEFLPSAIETSLTMTESTRGIALVVNPIESHGVETLRELALRLPHRKFVAQESWPLTPDQLAWVQQNLVPLSNVEFRRAAPPGPGLYGDARVLLVPHRIDNRPRVIAEAQANGIPVIVSGFPGLVEAMGDGGVSVAPDDMGAWCGAIEQIFTDEALYAQLTSKALAHSRRPEIDPQRVAARFAEILAGLASGA